MLLVLDAVQLIRVICFQWLMADALQTPSENYDKHAHNMLFLYKIQILRFKYVAGNKKYSHQQLLRRL
jgi:hypothetical protein